MKQRSLFRRLISKLRKTKESEPVVAPAPAANEPAEKPERRRTESSFEPLEGRIAPAILLNASTIQFTDTDGDLVTVKFSKSLFQPGSVGLNGLLDEVFKFQEGGTVRTDGSASDVHELAMLDLTKFTLPGAKSPAAGVNISITAEKQGANGDDLVNVGYIKAASSSFVGIALGHIVVDGDLGQIDAGDRAKPVAIASLTVESWGTLGLSTQLAAGASLESNVTSSIGKLTVHGDFQDASLYVLNGDVASKRPGTIGSLEIGGALRVSEGLTTTSAGFITTAGGIGSVKLGDIFGGAGIGSGKINTNGTIGSLTITGGLHGGAGKDSGQITATKGLGKIDVGTIWGGTGEASGRIVTSGDIKSIVVDDIRAEVAFNTGLAGKAAGSIATSGKIGSLLINGDLLGGKGQNSGFVGAGAMIGKVSVGGVIVGGEGLSSGQLIAGGGFGSIVLEGSLTGGVGDSSGAIVSNGNIKSITINNSFATDGAGITGGKGLQSGSISAQGNIGPVVINGGMDASVVADAMRGSGALVAVGNLKSVTINGDVVGGAAELSGAIVADGTMGAVKINGSLIGGAGLSSGSVIANSKISSVTITGSMDGGAGPNSASVIAGNDLTKPGDLGKITVLGRLMGDGIDSASIRAGGKLGTVTIGVASGPILDVLSGGAGSTSASIVGGAGINKATIHGNIAGGDGINSASIQVTGLLKNLKVTGGLSGGEGDGSGSIQAHEREVDFAFVEGALGTISIAGSVTGAVGDGSGQIYADGSAKKITIGGLNGGAGEFSGSIVTGRGVAAFVDEFTKVGGIKSLTINGAVNGSTGAGSANVEAGARVSNLTVNGDVTGAAFKTSRDFGAITINGNAVDLLVSAESSAKASARADVVIGKLTINGNISGSQILAGYDLFGNDTNGNAQIGAVKVSGNWVATSLVAGVADTDGDGFGDADDAVIGGGTISRIASVVIGGTVSGTAAEDDHFGFVAQSIGSVRIGGVLQALTGGKDVIHLAGVPTTNDTSIREVA